jgi:hypothetical protein
MPSVSLDANTPTTEVTLRDLLVSLKAAMTKSAEITKLKAILETMECHFQSAVGCHMLTYKRVDGLGDMMLNMSKEMSTIPKIQEALEPTCHVVQGSANILQGVPTRGPNNRPNRESTEKLTRAHQ